VRRVSQWMIRGLGGRSSPGVGVGLGGGLTTGEGGGGLITDADEWLEEGWANGFCALELERRRREGRARRAGRWWPINGG
jgi:hypothetical protein